MRIPFLGRKKRIGPLKPPRKKPERKRPNDGGEPALVEPDKPIPLKGGAAAALDFDDEA